MSETVDKRTLPKSPEHRAKIAASNRATKQAQALPPLQRFGQKVLIDSATGCWNWQASKDDEGYALFCANGKTVRAFRWIYQEIIGDIPEGLVPDHLCRNTSCVNPFHAEIVSNRENVLRGVSLVAQNARKVHCQRGHEFNAENTYVYRGRRHCRTCRRVEALARYHRGKGRAA